MNRKLGQRNSVVLALVAVLTLGLIAPIRVHAQATGATLSGAITDPSGAVIPNAKVSVKNTATGVVTNGTTNSAGLYTIPNLLPGPYEVTTSAEGFQAEVRSGITLTVGQQQALNVALHLGQATQTISVVGAAPDVQLTTSSIGGDIDSTAVRELPLNGRDWTTLAVLQPGVSQLQIEAPPATSSSRSARGLGAQLAVSGTRPQENNYRLDGISVVDYTGGAPGSTVGVALGVDAIAEFSVLTANQSAEYGRTAGGVVNAITKSGADQLHGDAYEFLRNSSLDAANYFDNAANIAKPEFRRNQFGASAGGAIQRNKTFFFADYEGLRQFLGNTSLSNTLSSDARNGVIHNTDGTTTTVTVSPLVKPYLAFYPLPNGGLLAPGNSGLYHFVANTLNIDNFVTARVDHKFSERDSLAGSWFYDNASTQSPEPFNTVLDGNLSFREMGELNETHTFSSFLVNTLRGGVSRITASASAPLSAINPLTKDTSLGTFDGKTAPGIKVSGLTGFVGGFGANSASYYYWTSYQAYDDAFLIKGTHTLKFGFAFERMDSNTRHGTNPNGLFSFGSISDFLTDNPKSFAGLFQDYLPTFGMRESLFGGYLQDDWRVRRNLTLNLGLRYEMVTPYTEAHGLVSNLRTLTSPTAYTTGPLFHDPTFRNFEPRVGFAWDPFGNGNTAVRASFGIFDVLPLTYDFTSTVANTPYVKEFNATNLPAGSFPTGAIANISSPPPSSLNYMYVQFNPPRNYVMIWNLNIQHQLTPNTAVMAGYVGNHGVHMINREEDANTVLPAASPEGYLWPSPVGSGTVLNPNAGDIRAIYWDGDSEYDALEAQVTKKMSHGFQVQGSYTWGKAIDTGSTSTHGDDFTNSIGSLLYFCKTCRRGLSDFNIGQTLVANYVWDVPTPKNWGHFASNVLGGWEPGGIFTDESGVPFTALIGGDPLGLNSQDPWAYPNRLSGAGCSSDVNPGHPNNYIKLNCFTVPMATPSIAAQCAPFSAVPGSCANLLGNTGRNTLVGPGIVNLDFSLMKNNYIPRISENFNVQFRAELFNALNRANFAAPIDNSTLFDETGAPIGGAGAVDSTSTTSREIQFALKLIW
jgi:hypothetical protein